jgi:hypothetical protein
MYLVIGSWLMVRVAVVLGFLQTSERDRIRNNFAKIEVHHIRKLTGRRG